MQPPDTEPATVPSGATTMVAPGGRGADLIVRTTVATPAVPPARQTVSTSLSKYPTGGSLCRNPNRTVRVLSVESSCVEFHGQRGRAGDSDHRLPRRGASPWQGVHPQGPAPPGS